MKKLLPIILVAALVFCAHPMVLLAENSKILYDFEDFYESEDKTLAPKGFTLSDYEALSSQEGIGAGILSAEGEEGKSVRLRLKSKRDLRLSLPLPSFAEGKGKLKFSLKNGDCESDKKVSFGEMEVVSLRKGDGQIFMLGKATGLYAPKDKFITFEGFYNENFIILMLYDDFGFIRHKVKGKAERIKEISFSFVGESLDENKESSLYIDDIYIEETAHISDAYMTNGENFPNEKGERNFHIPFRYKGFGSVKAQFQGFSEDGVISFSDFSGKTVKMIETDEKGEIFINGKRTKRFVSENALFSVLFCPMTGAGAVAVMEEGRLTVSEIFHKDIKFSGVSGIGFSGVAKDIYINSAPPFYVTGRYYDEFAVAMSTPQNGSILKENPKEATIVFNQNIDIISLKNSIYVNGSKLNEGDISQIDTYSVRITLPALPEGENCTVEILGAKSQRGREIFESIKFGKYYTRTDLGIYNSEGVLINKSNISNGTIYGKTIFTLK